MMELPSNQCHWRSGSVCTSYLHIFKMANKGGKKVKTGRINMKIDLFDNSSDNDEDDNVEDRYIQK